MKEMSVVGRFHENLRQENFPLLSPKKTWPSSQFHSAYFINIIFRKHPCDDRIQSYLAAAQQSSESFAEIMQGSIR
jgi:hypothetical protein